MDAALTTKEIKKTCHGHIGYIYAPRVISGFRIVSDDARLLIASLLPVAILGEESRIYAKRTITEDDIME